MTQQKLPYSERPVTLETSPAPVVKEVRPLYAIAQEITAKWPKVNYAAKPYLDAMRTLTTMQDKYICDSAHEIVMYFLSNATSWRGDDARRIKAELNRMLKAK